MSEQTKIVKADLWKVPFSKMRLDPDNERVDLGDMDWLVNSIRQEGVNEVMDGYKGKDNGEDVVFIRDGKRRFTAMEIIYDKGNGPDIIANVKTFDPRLVSKEQSIIQRLIRNEGKPFTPSEKSAAIKKLHNYNWDEKMIAEKLGISTNNVHDMLLFAGCPERLKKVVQNNDLSFSNAVKLIKETRVERFLEEYDTNKIEKEVNHELSQLPFVSDPSSANESNAPKKKRAKITSKDLSDGPNSLKELKSFRKLVENAPETDPIEMPECKLGCWEFLLKILDNKVTGKQISNFFQKD